MVTGWLVVMKAIEVAIGIRHTMSVLVVEHIYTCVKNKTYYCGTLITRLMYKVP
ncbi:hypothetical protein Hanom_Chr09g00859361 [Helianthus anomalus]